MRHKHNFYECDCRLFSCDLLRISPLYLQPTVFECAVAPLASSFFAGGRTCGLSGLTGSGTHPVSIPPVTGPTVSRAGLEGAGAGLLPSVRGLLLHHLYSFLKPWLPPVSRWCLPYRVVSGDERGDACRALTVRSVMFKISGYYGKALLLGNFFFI